MMPQLKVYIDTSVLGAIFDTEDPPRVEMTESLLETLRHGRRYSPHISNVVIEEIEKAPSGIRDELQRIAFSSFFNVLYETDECALLVADYVKTKIVPKRYRDDARHIAVAVLNDIDVIISWNCRHMANIDKKRMINAVNMMGGYRQVDIVTPMEVIDHD